MKFYRYIEMYSDMVKLEDA